MHLVMVIRLLLRKGVKVTKDLTLIYPLHLYFIILSNCPAECPACGKPLDSPAKLPCGHLLCDVCSKQNETCPAPECDAVIPKGYNYDPRTDDIE